MATEGRILVPADVSGGNPVRTLVLSTQASDEGAASSKDVQGFVLCDPNTAANLAAIVAKGTQGAFAVATQNLIDSGRTPWSAYAATPPTATTTDALMTLTPVSGGTASTAATSLTVPAGKTLRLMGMSITAAAAAATAVGVQARLRMTATGTLRIDSPIVAAVASGPTPAAIGGSSGNQLGFSDGFEFSGTQQFGVSISGNGGVVQVTLFGFLY